MLAHAAAHWRPPNPTGQTRAANYLKLPGAKGLGLRGRFLYVQLRLEPGSRFAVHLELDCKDGSGARVSVGPAPPPKARAAAAAAAPAAAAKAGSSASGSGGQQRRKPGVLHLELPADKHTGRWTLLGIDLAAAAHAAAGGGSGSTSAAEFAALRSVQLCASMAVRGVFSSDARFGLEALPRDMVLSHALGAAAFDAAWLPAEPRDVPEAPALSRLPANRASLQRVPGPAAVIQSADAGSAAAVAGGGGSGSTSAPGQVPPPPPPPLRRERSGTGVTATSAAAAALEAADAEEAAAFGPRPALALERVAAYTGEFAGSALWAQRTGELVFTAGSLVVAMEPPGGCPKALRRARRQRAAGNAGGVLSPQRPGRGQQLDADADADTAPVWGRDADDGDGSSGPEGAAGGGRQRRKQRLFVGHTAYVTCLALGGGGRLLATGQEGACAAVRLWDFEGGGCLAVVRGERGGDGKGAVGLSTRLPTPCPTMCERDSLASHRVSTLPLSCLASPCSARGAAHGRRRLARRRRAARRGPGRPRAAGDRRVGHRRRRRAARRRRGRPRACCGGRVRWHWRQQRHRQRQHQQRDAAGELPHRPQRARRRVLAV